jgi:ATP-dependent exoDNAse (exonuclease V) beta subunit
MLSRTSPSAKTYPIKPPERCPHCNSKRIIRKGVRRKKLESIPLFRCRSCGRTFGPGPRAIRNKTYPLLEILEILTLYDRGNTLAQTASKISSRYGHRIASSTISRWLAEHPALMTYRRLRERGRRLFTPTQIIRAHKLYHRQVYEFAYHRAKLAFLRDGTLDDKRAAGTGSTARFGALADFLESFPQTCPHDLFRREDGARSSQIAADFLTPEKLVVVNKQNAATETAALILPSVGTNYERHPKLQRFMLANDSTTIAVEVPVWLTVDDIAATEREHRVRLLSGDAETSITGHIDFLQVRNGAVHILAYKPDARTNKPIAQLTIYALALARLTGLKLFDIKCAWFNENEYCEFFPRTLLSHKPQRRAA